MASFGGPPTSDNRPATAPLGVPPSRGPIVAAVLVLVGVTFLVGFRLGGNGASPRVVVPSDGGNVSMSSPMPPPSTTAPPVQPAPLLQPDPGSSLLGLPAAPPSPRTPLVHPDAVSSELGRAAAGALEEWGWAVCDVDAVPICQPIHRPTANNRLDALAGTAGPLVPLDAFAGTSGPLASPSAGLAALWQALSGTYAVAGTHLVLVAQLSRPAQRALLARVDGREPNHEATPVEPGRDGITYFDLGAVTPGQYLVAVIDQVAPPTGDTILAQVVGFVVCPVGWLGNASAGCTP
jgi:hypothetical protein